MKKPSYKSLMPFLFAPVIFFSAGSVSAQTEKPMNVEVPFEFHVGGKSFAAGNYTVTKIRDEAFLIRSADGKNRIVAPAPAFGRIRKNIEAEQIVFNRYGNKYFLRQIFSDRNADGFALLKSKLEEAAYRESAQNDSGKNVRIAPAQVAVKIK